MANNSEAAADRIIDQRLKGKTKENYRRAVERFVRWLGDTHPTSAAYILNEDGSSDVVLENTTEALYKEFFGYITTKRDRAGNPLVPVQYQSFEYASTFRSALISLHTTRRVDVSQDQRYFFSTFFAGYKRQIAGLKQAGEMSLTEGKAPMSFPGYRFLAEQAVANSLSLLWLSLFSQCHHVMKINPVFYFLALTVLKIASRNGYVSFVATMLLIY